MTTIIKLRRYHPDCTCGWVGAQTFDPLFADAEASQHLLPLRLTYEYRHHTVRVVTDNE
jgi:ADP-heptose:LPS heptosyltransferase